MADPKIRNCGIVKVAFGERVTVLQSANLYGCTIGDDCFIGSNATILPVRICDDVVIGAGSVVTKDILKPRIYAGNPARLIRTLQGK
jgi:acetyltransferase-like isoleucine patch superfamily enzyme